MHQNESKKMISSWYSAYPAPNGVARLFRFDWNFGCAKIWWPDEPIDFYKSETSCSRTSLDDGQLLRATTVTTSSFWYTPIPKFATHSIPDLIDSFLIIYYSIPIYIYIHTSPEVLLNLFRQQAGHANTCNWKLQKLHLRCCKIGFHSFTSNVPCMVMGTDFNYH